jgi:hypothetical protein
MNSKLCLCLMQLTKWRLVMFFFRIDQLKSGNFDLLKTADFER